MYIGWWYLYGKIRKELFYSNKYTITVVIIITVINKIHNKNAQWFDKLRETYVTVIIFAVHNQMTSIKIHSLPVVCYR